MENILQKATELGVSKIIPVVSERTEVKEINHDRARKIIIEATEQSNQFAPYNYRGNKIGRFLKTFNPANKLLFADVNSKNNLKAEDLKGAKFLCVLVGLRR